MSSAHSPDDFFYDVDEAYVTNQTMSKYKTAGANDATLTKLPPEHVALARCLGGDIWMGEMTTTNARLALRRAPRLAGDHITDSFFQGVKEMARLSHPNLVAYLGVTCLSGTDIYAVAEFQDKGSLANVYQTVPLTWDIQLRMAIDVAEAIHYLHTLLPSPVPCEHLKSSMVLVGANYSCKLNIFHFMASFKASVLCKEMYGANRIAWKAPEVLINEWKNFLAADVYSLGVVLAEIGTTTRPFDKEISEVGMVQTDVWILDNVMAGRGVPPPFDVKSVKWINLPESFQKLVIACLDPVPSRRPNSGIVLQRLKDLKTSIHTAEL
ncbi:TKL protein kinase [Saprolegnia diclina VS20]|uniref:TKL protein kinase n=1 Tax=Saprolegnia diclina (strain VS20) TaxID=1156394 RepID=T0PXR3_SAPDV|nr:TKL protein kinase [Saprolegnia diclina VS20]EQC30339.1 TKL protein kinase [Saprolegnia diclina VS20]|eukprot:XP_008616192.1 TKL protein kinase [Saprolegnia diclina VS20]